MEELARALNELQVVERELYEACRTGRAEEIPTLSALWKERHAEFARQVEEHLAG